MTGLVAPRRAPDLGNVVEIAPGILWLRLPLPNRLNHVNAYILEDDDSWTVFDTGVADAACREVWQGLLRGLLSGRPIKRIIGSHFHFDHVGLVGWFHAQLKPALYMAETEYLLAQVFHTDPFDEGLRRQIRFFKSCGLDPVSAEQVGRDRLGIRDLQTALPPTFHRLRAGDNIRIGGREWEVLSGAGHAFEQLMLFSRGDRIFLSADQVLPEISPNISVGVLSPTSDPLGDFLRSLSQIKAVVTDEAFVLPGHRTPFFGLHERIDQLISHHHLRCDAILQSCRDVPFTALELVPVVFQRDIEQSAMAPALGEAVAHANYLQRQGSLKVDRRADGALLYRAS